MPRSAPPRSGAPAHRPALPPLLLALLAAPWAGGAMATEITTGEPRLQLRWDNTVKASLASRLKAADPALLASANHDDGNRNFGKGLISQRVDWLSEADLTWDKRLGARLSAAAWHDRAYLSRNDNPGFAGGAFPNQTSASANQFTEATRTVHGRHAEVLDAFAFARFELGEANGSVRAGHHALVWGESLFFGTNAVAGGQMPVDVVKLVSVPGTPFKEAIRPVPMLSGQVQLDAHLTLGAYVQTGWQASRTAAVGSYFSNADPAVDGGERLLTGPSSAAVRDADQRPRDGGQWGLQMRLRGDETDYGVYLLNFHAKTPQLVPRLSLLTPPAVPEPTAVPTGYAMAYQQDIKVLGLSASRTFGDFNVALEASVRHNQDLASTQGADASAFAPVAPTDNQDHPGYAVGRTAHLNVSTLATLPETALWREASLVAELAWNRLLSVSRNAAALDPNGTRDGVALRLQLEPTYRGVLPGMDLGVPLGLGWAPKGSRPLAMSSPNAWIPEGGGDVSIGLNGSYHDSLRFSLSLTHYLGTAAPFNDAANAYSWQQTLKDRDFVSASVRYAF
ncbi:DUF1302 domain-containing protein [Ideonella sp. TBM-1]|uniref:DUF1302 domain-containing protein n=2 Tax=Ideonella livida TaxID=2707176 RepID=A0A7C9TNR4_9BURK|nr:DUF1302 domain-containing protein [Ideonella livida]